jgi:hypothetical protein
MTTNVVACFPHIVTYKYSLVASGAPIPGLICFVRRGLPSPWFPFLAHHPCLFNTTHLGCLGSCYRNTSDYAILCCALPYCGAEACAFATSTTELLGTRAKTAQDIPSLPPAIMCFFPIVCNHSYIFLYIMSVHCN